MSDKAKPRGRLFVNREGPRISRHADIHKEQLKWDATSIATQK